MTKEVYKLIIDAYSPESIPMARLAEYMSDLAALLGHTDRVHFVSLEEGSTVLVHAVEPEAVPKVRDRVRDIQTRDAPEEAMRAFRELDKRLEKDNAVGVLWSHDNRKVVEFPGRRKPKRLMYGPFNQDGCLDGQLIRIGGEEDLVPVHLREERGITHICQANHRVARDLAPYLFGQPIRVQGNGRWFRDGDGNWEMKRFTIDSFKALRDDTLQAAVQRLRGIDSPLRDLEDPLGELHKLRHG